MEALGRLARVITWDARGYGASDPIRSNRVRHTEVFADDMRAVLRAADSQRASLFDLGNGGASCPSYAATYPERVQSLILVNVRQSYPELGGLSALQRKRLAMRLRSPERLRFENPRAAHDPVVQRWWGHAVRLVHSPEQMARHIADAVSGSEMGSVLSALRTPTLVLHRRDNRVWDIETSRAAAAMIPDARFVELPGSENDIFLGDTAPVLAEIERFLAEPEVDVEHDRPLATVLFTDIVSSTEQLAERGDDAWRRILDDHDHTMDRIVTAHRGRVVRQTGDGILATFDGPARAVHCAAAMLDAAQEAGRHAARRLAHRRDRTPATRHRRHRRPHREPHRRPRRPERDPRLPHRRRPHRRIRTGVRTARRTRTQRRPRHLADLRRPNEFLARRREPGHPARQCHTTAATSTASGIPLSDVAVRWMTRTCVPSWSATAALTRISSALASDPMRAATTTSRPV